MATKKSKKKIKDVEVEVFSPYELDGMLGDIVAKLVVYVEQYGADARLDYSSYGYSRSPYEGDSPGFRIIVQEEESDEEYAARIAKEKEEAKDIESKERKQLEVLLKKYGAK